MLSQSNKETAHLELRKFCSELTEANRGGIEITSIARYIRIIKCAMVALMLFSYLSVFWVLTHLEGEIEEVLCSLLIINFILCLNVLASRAANNIKQQGAFENELCTFEAVINKDRNFLNSIDFELVSSADRAMATETFVAYALRSLSVCRVEKSIAFPVTERRVTRYGAEFLGVFEPDLTILRALGDLLRIGILTNSLLCSTAKIESIVHDLWILRTKTGNERRERKTMPDGDYEKIQTQFVRYLGCYGSARSVGVLHTLARDKRYPALQGEAKQAIEQVKSRMAGANGELLHIPSPAQDNDLLHSTDDYRRLK